MLLARWTSVRAKYERKCCRLNEPKSGADASSFVSRLSGVYASAMIRAVAVAWLSLLLLSMQQQLVVHELDHLRVRLEQGQKVVVKNPQSDSCLECSLLAGGAGVVPGDDGVSAVAWQASSAVAIPLELPLVKSSPASYLSRAPPAIV